MSAVKRVISLIGSCLLVPWVLAAPEQADIQQEITAYRDAIDRLQFKSGTYSNELFEHYQGLGLVLQQDGQHEEALKLLRQAAHIKRINSGLYTLEIEPLIEHMVNSHIALGDWQGMDAQLHRFIQALIVEPRETQLQKIDVFERVIRWHLYAYNQQLGPWALGNLNKARNLSDHVIVLLQQDSSKHRETLMSFHTYRTRIIYAQGEIARQEQENAIRKERLQSGYQKGFADLHHSNNLSTFFRDGHASLATAIKLTDADTEAGLQQRAEARAQLADWYLLYERYGAASETYRLAWTILQAQEDEAKRAQLYSALFERPIALHERNVGVLAGQGQAQQKGYVDMELSISRRGRVERSRAVQAEPVNVGKMRQTQRDMRYLRFRPRIVSGQVARATGINYRHEYLYVGARPNVPSALATAGEAEQKEDE